jgi:glyoxylase-like metal-dependent hydrolase (beta-lactamase superfamily II)
MPNTFSIGDLSVTVLSDGEATFPGFKYFQVPEKAWTPHLRWLDHKGDLVFPFSCFLVRGAGQTVLVDTGLGPLQRDGFRGGDLFHDMAAAGVTPEEIDSVFITHLHFDHVGTAARKTSDGWVPSFPNASYRWTSAEQTYWLGPSASGLPANKNLLEAIAPRWKPIEDGESVAPGINVIATPGHTPGHAGVVLSSGSERAFILGDAISCPVQLEESEWSGMGDVDPKLARQSQEAVAREAEGTGALLAASHFPGLTFGRVLRGEGRRYWEAVG